MYYRDHFMFTILSLIESYFDFVLDAAIAYRYYKITQRKKSMPAVQIPDYRRIPEIWRILKAFGHRYFGMAIWRNFGDFLKAFGSKLFFWRNILTYHFL